MIDDKAVNSPIHLGFELESTNNSSTKNQKPSIRFSDAINYNVFSLEWILKDDTNTVVINNNFTTTLFLLLNSMIGSGILVQGYVFYKSGIIVVLFEYIIIGTMNYAGVEILITCAQYTNVFNYADLADKVLGYYGALAVDVCIFIGGYGSLLSYILIIGTLMTEVTGNCGEWYCNIVFLTVIPVTLFTVPLCLLRNFGHLAIASYISILVIALIIGLVLIGGPIESVHDKNGNNYNLGSWIGSVNTIGDIVFALGYITATFHAYQAMEDKTIERFNQVTLATTVTGCIMCFITGLVGYLCFVHNTETNILQNFTGTVGSVFKIFLIIHLILFIPGDFVIMRSAFLRIFRFNALEISNMFFISITLLFIYSVTFNAVMLQVFAKDSNNLGNVVNVTGGTAGSVLYFIIPGLCGIQLFPDDKYRYYNNITLVIFGCIIFMTVIVTIADG